MECAPFFPLLAWTSQCSRLSSLHVLMFGRFSWTWPSSNQCLTEFHHKHKYHSAKLFSLYVWNNSVLSHKLDFTEIRFPVMILSRIQYPSLPWGYWTIFSVYKPQPPKASTLLKLVSNYLNSDIDTLGVNIAEDLLCSKSCLYFMKAEISTLSWSLVWKAKIQLLLEANDSIQSGIWTKHITYSRALKKLKSY